MKFVLRGCALLLVGIAAIVSGAEDQPNYQQGTILSIKKHKVRSPDYSGGDNVSDAPLQSESYAYHLSLRVGCTTYVVHFDSPLENLPSAFSPTRPIQVHLAKHFMLL